MNMIERMLWYAGIFSFGWSTAIYCASGDATAFEVNCLVQGILLMFGWNKKR